MDRCSADLESCWFVGSGEFVGPALLVRLLGNLRPRRDGLALCGVKRPVKSELAEELLNRLMGWDRAGFHENVRQLEALASYKFDEYGNFRPGVKFFESLAAWLDQFDELGDRASALEFVLERLIFISDAEMTHLIELVYPDHIEPVLRRHAASRVGCSPFAVSQIVSESAFVGLRRRTLVLGASDGHAWIGYGVLRHSCPMSSFCRAQSRPLI